MHILIGFDYYVVWLKPIVTLTLLYQSVIITIVVILYLNYGEI